MTKSLAAAAVAVLLSGCTFGAPAVKRVPAATSPDGVAARIDLGNSTMTGELLAVTDSSFIVLTDSMVAEVRFADARRCRFPPFASFSRCRFLTDRDAAEVRLGSRHPYGIPADALAALLARHGQTAVTRVP